MSVFFTATNVLAGYDLHITRAKDWTESKKTPISLQEWKEFIKTDKEFRLVDAAETKNAKTAEVLKMQSEGMAIWADPKNKSECYFYYQEGEISVKNPEERIIDKMKIVAQKLKAKVIGDEGEEYK
jgi:predicted transglutaminase-like protease